MYVTKAIIYFLFLSICLSCNKESCNPYDIELRIDFTEEEFLTAIIGQWESVLENAAAVNVTYLEFCEQDHAKITLKEGSIEEFFEGNYTVEFTLLPPASTETRASITIKSPKRDIILSTVTFSPNSLFPASMLFLNISGPIWGLLSRVE